MGDRIAITKYTVHIGVKSPVRCALVSDLHDRDPEEALSLLQEENPDFIVAAGDIMERHERGASEWTVEKMNEWQGIPKRRSLFTKVIKLLDGSLLAGQDERKRWDEANGRRFLREAGKIAPVIMGVGNHEWYFLPEDYSLMNLSRSKIQDNTYRKRENSERLIVQDDLKYAQTESGQIILLDNRDCEVTIKGQTFRIGALSTRYDLNWLSGFSGVQTLEDDSSRIPVSPESDAPKILICHHPDYYIRYVKDTPLDTFDLVVAGHTHGGQWRLFSKGGKRRGVPVFAPGQGLFPKYAYGRYGKMLVSSGVSNTTTIPRFGNPCEVVMIEME